MNCKKCEDPLDSEESATDFCGYCERENKKDELLAVETRTAKEIQEEIDSINERVNLLYDVHRAIRERESIAKLSHFEKEWLDNVEENRDKIVALVNEANEKMEQAVELSDEFAIPFLARYIPRAQMYVPHSFRDRKIDKFVDDVFPFILVRPKENLVGWEMSGPNPWH